MGCVLTVTVCRSDKPPQMEGFPMKEWTIEIYLLDEDDQEHPAKCFNKVTYHLHPSFAVPDQSELFTYTFCFSFAQQDRDAQLTRFNHLQPSTSPPSAAQTRAGASSR